MNLNSIKMWLIVLCFTVPVIIGASRDYVLHAFVDLFGVTAQAGRIVEDRHCRGTLCRRVYEIEVSHQEQDFAIGYYSAAGESIVLREPPVHDWEKQTLDLNWFDFIVKTVPSAKEAVKAKLWIACFANKKAAKLGLETNRIFFGPERAVRSLAFLYTLFSVHLYLILAIGVMASSAIFALTKTMEAQKVNLVELFEGGMIATALLGFSHVFDASLIGLGVPDPWIVVLTRLMCATSIVYFFLAEETPKVRRLWILGFAAALLPGVLPLKDGGIWLFGTYRWIVTAILLLTIWQIARKKSSLLLSPYCALLAFDTLVIHGFISIRSNVYFSPLALPGLFVSHHSHELLLIINRNLIFLKSLQLKGRLELAKKEKFENRLDWHGFLKESLGALGAATSAQRIALFFKHAGAPVVLSMVNKTVVAISDGRVPRLFARVLQTKEEYWWIESREIERLRGPRLSAEEVPYQSDMAIIVPIVNGHEVFAIVSLTDFDRSDSLKSSFHEKQRVEAMVRNYIDVVAAELLVRHERDQQSDELVAKRLMEAFLSKASLCVDRPSVVHAFWDVLGELGDFRCVFFELDGTRGDLCLASSRHLTGAMHQHWAKLGFQGKSANFTSPLAMVLNEKRVVWIDDVTQFSDVLDDATRQALMASMAKSALILPVLMDEKLLGMMVIMDGVQSTLVGRNLERIVAMPLQYFGFKLAECERTDLVEKQSRLLGNFVDADLARSLVEADAEALPIGREEKGVLIVQDLRGSTVASKRAMRPSDYARNLYRFYCGADKLGEEVNCRLEITVGDSLVYLAQDLAEGGRFSIAAMAEITHRTLAIADETMGVERILSVFHHGEVFKGIFTPKRRLRWDIAGADFNDLFKMESAAKGIKGAIVAMSEDFVKAMPPVLADLVAAVSHQSIAVKDTSKIILVFNQEQFEELLGRAGVGNVLSEDAHAEIKFAS